MSSDLKRGFRQTERKLRRVLGMRADDIHPDIPDDAKVLVHIGKSGGTSIRMALKETPLGQDMHAVHIKRPPIGDSLSYYIIARGLISRALSASNWCYKLVVEDEAQKDRVLGEYELLKKYGTLNALANDLYGSDGTPNTAALGGLSWMHHIRENIAFYLDPLLDWIEPQQVAAVPMRENLNADNRARLRLQRRREAREKPWRRGRSRPQGAGRSGDTEPAPLPGPRLRLSAEAVLLGQDRQGRLYPHAVNPKDNEYCPCAT